MTRHVVIALVCAATAMAGIDGTVMNRTTGQAQPNVILQLLQPSQQGMQTLGTAKSDASGKFHFDQEPPGPKLVQAIYAGVLYSHMIPPGTPTSGVEVPVYDSTKDRAAAHLAEHMMLLQPTGAQLAVSETFIYQNTGKETFNDPANGSARFEVQADLTQSPSVSITPPGRHAHHASRGAREAEADVPGAITRSIPVRRDSMSATRCLRRPSSAARFWRRARLCAWLCQTA